MSTISIFYADDDEDDFMFFNDAVAKITSEYNQSIQLHLHPNGERLLENIKNNKMQNGLVFLDINMPIRSGFKLLEEIRNEATIQEVPVIMYSTSFNDSDIRKSHHLGANYYVVKPYKFDDLIDMIRNVLTKNWNDKLADLNDFTYRKE